MSDPAAGAARLPRRQRPRVRRGATACSASPCPGSASCRPRSALDLGPHALGVHAFVCRNPDENHERVYRWLLERNLKTYAVSYAVDHLGDIYLDARLPLVAGHARRARPAARRRCSPTPTGRSTPSSSSGFASSIRKEWEWRNLRGESTRNLEAFRGWLETDATPDIERPRVAPWSGRSSTCVSRCGEVAAARRDRRGSRPAARRAARRPRARPPAPAVPGRGTPTDAGCSVPRSGRTAAPGRRARGASTSPWRWTAAWSASRRWRGRSSPCCARSTRSRGWPATSAAAGWPRRCGPRCSPSRFDHLGAVAAVSSARRRQRAVAGGLATARVRRQRPQPDQHTRPG